MPATYRIGGATGFNKPAKSGHSNLFGSESRRFASTSAISFIEGAGPGEYAIAYDASNAGVHCGKAEPMGAKSARSFNKNSSKGKGTFNTTNARPSTLSHLGQKGRDGGPGEHDLGHLYNVGRRSASSRKNSPLQAGC